MILTGKRVIFENLNTVEYYKLQGELKKLKLNGYIHFTFFDHEAAIFYKNGEPFTALQEYKRWVGIGEEYIEPVENKAVSSEGKMSVIELSEIILDLFKDRKISDTIETELSAYLTLKTLLVNLQKERSTCIVKFEDDMSRGYALLLNGNIAGASYISQKDKLSGDPALQAMGKAYQKGRVFTYIYYLEKIYGPEPIPEPVEAPAIPEIKAPAMEEAKIKVKQTEQVPVPVQVSISAEQLKPVEPLIPIKAEVAVPSKQLSKHVPVKVITSHDLAINIANRSRMNTLEAFEEQNMAWVSDKTLAELGVKEASGAKLVLPSGKQYPIKLQKASFMPEEVRLMILPQKMRKRLSLEAGSSLALIA